MRTGSRLTPLVAAWLLVGTVLLGTATPAAATPAAAVPNAATPAAAAPGYPEPVGRCVDTTGVLGAALCARITAVLLRDEATSSDEIAVAVVPGTGGASIEAWSTGLFNTWGVGKRDRDNGVLLVVAMDDRRLRLETGRGMAKRLPDSVADRIVRTVITPRFAEGAAAVGILAGLDEVRRHLGHRVVPADRLAGLAAFAPVPPRTAVAPARTDGTGPGGDPAVGGDGDLVTEDGEVVLEDDVPEDFAGDVTADDGGFPAMVVLVLGGVGLLALFMLIAKAGSGARSGGSGYHHHPGRSGRSGSTSAAGAWSSSGSSDSSGGSSFGGGSSDGGGSSGSW